MRRPVAWVGAALPLLAGLASCTTTDPGEEASPSPTPVVAPADYARLEKTPVRESLAELGLPASNPPEAEPVAAHDFVVTVREVAVMDVLSPEQRDAMSLRIEPRALRRAVGEGPFPAGPGREFLVAWVVEPPEAPLRDAHPVPDTLREIEVSFRLEATFRADGTTHSYQRFDRGDNTGTLTLTPID